MSGLKKIDNFTELSLCQPFRGDIKAAIQIDTWIMEEKYDGDRVAIYVEDDEVLAYGRRGPLVVPGLLRNQKWGGVTALYDGEMLADRYMVFDILMAKNNVLTRVPLFSRKRLLKAAQAILPPAVEVVPYASTEHEKLTLLKGAVGAGKEGVILKDSTMAYMGGRHAAWQKLKFYKTLEAIVLELGGDGKPESARLGLHRGLDNIKDIGGVKIPMKYQLAQNIEVGDVIEVRYLYHTTDTKLYQPVFLRKRLDKTAQGCTLKQIFDNSTGLPYYMSIQDE